MQHRIVVQVLHHGDLALGVAAGHGDDHGPQLVRALIRAKAAGEQAQAIGDLHDVFAGAARGGERAGHHLAPDGDVVSRVAGDDGLAGGTGGALDANDVLLRGGQQSEGIAVPQVGLFREGQVLEVVQPADVLGLDAGGVHARAVHRHVLVFPLHGLHQPLTLQFAQLLAVDAFHGGIEDSAFRLAHSN